MVECGCVARAQNTSRWHWTICLKLKFNESIFWQLPKNVATRFARKLSDHPQLSGTGLYVVMYKKGLQYEAS